MFHQLCSSHFSLQDKKFQSDSNFAYDAKVLTLNAQLSSLQAEAAKTAGEKKELSDMIASQAEQLEVVETSLKEERERAEMLMSKVETLQQNMSKKSKELLKYQTEREEVEHGLVMANEKLMKKSKDVQEKERKVVELQTQVERMQEELSEQERKIRTWQQTCERQSSKVTDLQCELDDSYQKRTSLVKDCGQLKRRIDELEDEVSRSEEKIVEMKRLQEERDTLKNRSNDCSSLTEPLLFLLFVVVMVRSWMKFFFIGAFLLHLPRSFLTLPHPCADCSKLGRSCRK